MKNTTEKQFDCGVHYLHKQKIIARTNSKKLPPPWTCQLHVPMTEIYQRLQLREAAVMGWRFGGNEPDTVVSNNLSVAIM